jgi:hypothetical protein
VNCHLLDGYIKKLPDTGLDVSDMETQSALLSGLMAHQCIRNPCIEDYENLYQKLPLRGVIEDRLGAGLVGTYVKLNRRKSGRKEVNYPLPTPKNEVPTPPPLPRSTAFGQLRDAPSFSKTSSTPRCQGRRDGYSICAGRPNVGLAQSRYHREFFSKYCSRDQSLEAAQSAVFPRRSGEDMAERRGVLAK